MGIMVFCAAQINQISPLSSALAWSTAIVSPTILKTCLKHYQILKVIKYGDIRKKATVTELSNMVIVCSSMRIKGLFYHILSENKLESIIFICQSNLLF